MNTTEASDKKKIIPKHSACLYENNLDSNSTYSHIYITSVVHQDLIELKKRIKEQYSLINCPEGASLKEYKKQQSSESTDNFDKALSKINLSVKRDIELCTEMKEIKEDDFQEEKKEKKKNFLLSIIKRQKTLFTLNQKLFLYSLLISVISFSIQLIFIGVLAKEYASVGVLKIKDHEQIALRFIALIAITIMVWIEFKRGSDKFNHAIYQKFLYISAKRRLVSAINGLMQMMAGLSCLFCCTMLVAQNDSVVNNVKTLGAMMMLLNIDNWIGDYFLCTNKRLKVYTRNHLVQIWCYDKNNHPLLTFLLWSETIIFLFIFGGAFYWMVLSVEI